jgi:hypothetical protein
LSFIKRISSDSNLTETQLEALALYKRVISGELTLEKASKMKAKPAKVGAYYRTVQQGRGNLKQAVMTLAAGVWLGYIKLEDLRRLFDLVGNSPSPFEQEQSDQLLPILEALVEKMVM